MSTYVSVAGLQPHQIWDGAVARPLHGERIINGERRELQAGDTYSIRSGIPRSGEAGPDVATVVDVFSPARSDWKEASRLAVAEGRWP